MSYANEYQTTLQRIDDDNRNIRTLPYFLRVAARWHERYVRDSHDKATMTAVDHPRVAARWHERYVRDSHDKATRTHGHPRVVVLGHGIPEELIYACGTTPYFLLGGSHASCSWSDDLMPRDSDPVSRSILGYALQIARTNGTDPLFVVPMANDNLRKIAYILKREGHAVHPVDIPPEGGNIVSQRAWEMSLIGMVEAIQNHVGGRITAASIRRARALVDAARDAMVRLEQTIAQCEGILSGEAGLLVLNTYYHTDNLAEWTSMVHQLTNEIQAKYHARHQPNICQPRVLVVGSPLVFPQYKVPSLIHDAGLTILATVDASSTTRFVSLAPQELRGGTKRLIGTIARKHYVLDASGSHVANDALVQYVEYLVSTEQVDGVVCHVLKGHIEFDFELTRLEALLDERNIPVFRLETDYQYQDVEQLRIRLEAFAEMLEQRAFVASQAMRLHCA